MREAWSTIGLLPVLLLASGCIDPPGSQIYWHRHMQRAANASSDPIVLARRCGTPDYRMTIREFLSRLSDESGSFRDPLNSSAPVFPTYRAYVAYHFWERLRPRADMHDVPLAPADTEWWTESGAGSIELWVWDESLRYPKPPGGEFTLYAVAVTGERTERLDLFLKWLPSSFARPASTGSQPL
jgi:hypothetical protein